MKRKSFIRSSFLKKAFPLFSVLCLSLLSLPVFAQTKITVSGVVTDSSGQPVPGVTVWAPALNVASLTEPDGSYSITLTSDRVEIHFDCMGYVSQTFIVTGSRGLNVSLADEAMVLENAVVVGYGTQRKETVTGSVTAVATKDLLQSPQANISNALAGRMPGLLAVQRSGEPGKDASTLRIRGVGTFAGGQDPLIMVDGIESSNYNNIDPNEIESVSILKDASATAVYGVRGANGVLLITTKRGQVGKPKVSLSTNVALSNFPFLRENMNSYEYAKSLNEAYAYDSYITGNYTQRYTDAQVEKYRTGEDPILYPSIDWYDYLLKKVSTQSQSNLNIRGGTEKVKYFFSLGYFTQDGMLKTDVIPHDYDNQIRYRRYNFRSNFDINITKNLETSIDLSTQMDDSRGPNWDTPLLMDMLSSVPPNRSPGVIDGHVVTLSEITNDTWNPIGVYNNGWHRDYGNTLNGSVRLNYKMDYLLPGLKLRGAVSYKNYNLNIRKYEVSNVTYDARQTADGIVYVPSGDPTPVRNGSSTSKNRRLYMEAGIEYSHRFGKHDVGGLVLYNQSKYYDPSLAFLVPNGYQGIVGRVTYGFDGKYLAEFDMGYNGTENFAKGRRFGFFPSGSAGWVVTDEKFIPKNDVLTFLKFRASYGVVGNDKIGGDRFLYRPTSYSYYNGAYYFGGMGHIPPGVPWLGRGKTRQPAAHLGEGEEDERRNGYALLEGQDNTDRRLVRREARQHSLEQGHPA